MLQGGLGSETGIDSIPRVPCLVQEWVIRKPRLPRHSLLRVGINLDHLRSH